MNAPSMRRHTARNRCPICEGADGDPRGQEKRCDGWTSGDGEWVHCSREELAGGIDPDPNGRTFAHRMTGACRCGRTHGMAASSRSTSGGEIEATYDYRDEHGVLVFQVVRKVGKRFLQRVPDGAGGWVWKLGDARRVPYRLPELLAAPADAIVYVVEGEKDVETLSARGLVATCNPGGAGKWPAVVDAARAALRDRDVVVVADADAPGRKHARDVEASLRGVARSVRALETPSPHKDVSDLLGAGATLDELVPLAEVEATPPQSSRGDATKRPPNERRVRVGPDLMRVADDAVVYLADDLAIFERDMALVRVVRAEVAQGGIPAGTPRIRPVTLPTLRERLSALANWEKEDKRSGSWRRCAPPAEIAQIVLDRGSWPGLRRLVGVIEAPALRPDGSIIEEPGYDAKTGFVFMPNAVYPPVPDMPSNAELRRARDALLEVIVDFPLADDHGRSVWLALVLTMLARPAIDGPTPITAVEGNVAGVGKSKAVDAVSVIATGREAPRTTQPEDEGEWRKRVTSIVLEGAPLMLLDNLLRPLGGESIDALLTGRVWKDRGLGKNEMVEAPNVTLWTATGNNLEIVGDTTRRALRLRLDSPTEAPEDRDGFRHPDLLAWVRAERPRLVAAALTLLRAHAVAGRPMGNVKPWGSFEAWSRVVAAAVVFAGLPDPQLGRVRSSDDPAKAALAALYAAWPRLAPDGITAKRAIEALYPPRAQNEPPPHDGFEDLREAIDILCMPLPGRPPSAGRLGNVLRRNHRRVIAGARLDHGGVAHGGAARWIVRDAASGDTGDSGDAAPTLRGEDRGP